MKHPFAVADGKISNQTGFCVVFDSASKQTTTPYHNYEGHDSFLSQLFFHTPHSTLHDLSNYHLAEKQPNYHSTNQRLLCVELMCFVFHTTKKDPYRDPR